MIGVKAVRPLSSSITRAMTSITYGQRRNGCIMASGLHHAASPLPIALSNQRSVSYRLALGKAQPGDRLQKTGSNPTRGTSAPVAPCCDVTASNSTQKKPGQPARFFMAVFVAGAETLARYLRLKKDIQLFLGCRQSLGQRPAIVFRHAVLPFQEIGNALGFDPHLNPAQTGQQ